MSRSGINSSLFRAISQPPDWVSKMDQDEYFLKNHENVIEDFLSATTDSVRLVRASKASRDILEQYDMAELEDLRARIQASELLRVIPYSRQTDHSAHTLYLYLLGIYLFFACKPIREGIARFFNKKDESPELLSKFLFQWVFVSLLHDIGYIFQGRSKSEIRAVDRVFRASSVIHLMDKASQGVKGKIREEIARMGIRPFEPIQNPEDMLSMLHHLQWGDSADVKDDAFESFTTYGPYDSIVDPQITGSTLEEYGYMVASSGYDGLSDGAVDHAIASGLFLFRYSTFWYWLAKKNNFAEDFAVYKKGWDKDDISSACLATAAHNLIGFHAKKIGPLNFEKNPILYLGVLCDELQKWDRFPAGERHIVDLQSFEKYCTDSERIIIPDDDKWDRDVIDFCLEEEELAKGINAALLRLAAHENFVRVSPMIADESDSAENEGSAQEQVVKPSSE